MKFNGFSRLEKLEPGWCAHVTSIMLIKIYSNNNCLYVYKKFNIILNTSLGYIKDSQLIPSKSEIPSKILWLY